MGSKTLSPQNQFCFNCPIFKVDTKISTCLQLRDIVWRGKRPDVRKGCQVALSDSKCPVDHIVKSMIRNPNSDPYHSAEPVVGKLAPEILARIAPVQVQGRTMDMFGVSARERELLEASNDYVVAAADKVKKPRKLKDMANDTLDDVPVEEKVSKPDSTVLAAQRGDMSAAINAATREMPAQRVETLAAPIAPAQPKPQPAPAAESGKPLSLLERARLAQQAAA